MVNLKNILKKLNVKHTFPDTLTIADVGKLSFDKVTYDQELIILENTETPNILLRCDRDRSTGCSLDFCQERHWNRGGTGSDCRKNPGTRRKRG